MTREAAEMLLDDYVTDCMIDHGKRRRLMTALCRGPEPSNFRTSEIRAALGAATRGLHRVTRECLAIDQAIADAKQRLKMADALMDREEAKSEVPATSTLADDMRIKKFKIGDKVTYVGFPATVVGIGSEANNTYRVNTKYYEYPEVEGVALHAGLPDEPAPARADQAAEAARWMEENTTGWSVMKDRHADPSRRCGIWCHESGDWLFAATFLEALVLMQKALGKDAPNA